MFIHFFFVLHFVEWMEYYEHCVVINNEQRTERKKILELKTFPYILKKDSLYLKFGILYVALLTYFCTETESDSCWSGNSLKAIKVQLERKHNQVSKYNCEWNTRWLLPDFMRQKKIYYTSKLFCLLQDF
jgi:hypothetical protein